MASVLILGGGFGGAATAITARELLGDSHDVAVVDRATESYLCGVNPAVITGDAEPMARSISGLTERGIRYLGTEITRIDFAGRTVETTAGVEPWDYLVVALGVSYDWEAVPGSSEAYSFYDTASATRLRQRLREFDGGSIAIGVGGSPYRCPPAPFEAILMIDSSLRQRGIRERSALTVVIPEPKPLGVAGAEASDRVTSILADRGITLGVGKRVATVAGKTMRFDDGSEVEADVPITVPVHRVPEVVSVSGLTGGKPFVPVDHDTLETVQPNVFAIGDVNTIPLGDNRGIPKAGVFAAGQGRHVAAVIASRLGTRPDPGGYDGIGHCFLMLGDDLGARVGGDFYAADVGLEVPSAAGRLAKDDWEKAWARFEV